MHRASSILYNLWNLWHHCHHSTFTSTKLYLNYCTIIFLPLFASASSKSSLSNLSLPSLQSYSPSNPSPVYRIKQPHIFPKDSLSPLRLFPWPSQQSQKCPESVMTWQKRISPCRLWALPFTHSIFLSANALYLNWEFLRRTGLPHLICYQYHHCYLSMRHSTH